jgi:hypothetical protein
VPSRQTWNGDELKRRARRAMGRADVSIGEQIGAEATIIVHKISGNLGRSIHTAPIPYVGRQDEAEVVVGNLATARNVLDGFTALVEVGSWLAYACVEETGRKHYYIAPAAELVLPTGHITIKAAFKEEGL